MVPRFTVGFTTIVMVAVAPVVIWPSEQMAVPVAPTFGVAHVP